MKRVSYRVLLIEDDASHRYIYRRFLEQQGAVSYEIHEAASAEAGLAACGRVRPDCVIVDYRLPDTDGLALLPRLKAATQAPIIFMTAHPEPLTMTKAYRAGAVSYLSKDFLSSETFQAAVVDALRL